MTKVAFVTDEHYPFQDEHARAVALQIVRDFQPDILTTGSDGMDFYNLSHFNKNPKTFSSGLQKEIMAWRVGQREWKDAAPNARRFFLMSNHIDRLRRYLWENQELADLEALQLPNLLELDSQGIEWEWHKGEQANIELEVGGALIIKHGSIVRKFSSYSAKAELEKEFHAVSLLTGHTHRMGSYYVRTRMGVMQAHEGGCLCRLDPEYDVFPNWQQGIVLASVVNGQVSIEPIVFAKRGEHTSAVWREKEYLG